jgi:nucleoside-diphosphate-sugar epimerase
MRVFVAGASGVIGRRVAELLVAQGHAVVGMTRSIDKADRLREVGVEPVVCDVYDVHGLTVAVGGAAPDLVMHQLTDLPDDVAQIREFGSANARIRREGTANLLAAASKAAGSPRVLAQSVAWPIPGDGGAAVSEMEEAVLAADGVVIRYGQFYGPGTYHAERPEGPAIHIDEAARRTLEMLDAPCGIVTVTEM